jgi:hypothetical protein
VLQWGNVGESGLELKFQAGGVQERMAGFGTVNRWSGGEMPILTDKPECPGFRSE